MGTWSHEPFGNDTANDWAYELEGSSDLSIVEATLRRALEEGSGYLDADVGAEAVAAAEVLAKALGRGTQADAYTEKVDAWLKTIPAEPVPELLTLAQQALTRVLGEQSELSELWLEAEDADQWRASVVALRTALAQD